MCCAKFQMPQIKANDSGVIAGNVFYVGAAGLALPSVAIG
jgi:hypothetical protein